MSPATAPSFEEANAEIIDRWREFDAPLVHTGPNSSFALDVGANWKLAVENYSESYHLPWVHPGLNSYSRLEDHYNIAEYGRFSGQGSRVYRPALSEDGAAFPDFPGLSQKWDSAAEYLTVFPNVLLGVHRDHAFALVLEPKGVDRTIERGEIYYADQGVRGEVLCGAPPAQRRARGRGCSRRTSSWWKACSADGAPRASTAVASRRSWTCRRMSSTIGWPRGLPDRSRRGEWLRGSAQPPRSQALAVSWGSPPLLLAFKLRHALPIKPGEIDGIDHQRRKPACRVASAMIWRANGKSRRGHSISSSGCMCSCGTLRTWNKPA